MFELISLTINRTTRVRRETRKKRDYVVAEMTLIVPGVLNGSRGALYYPPEEVAKNVDTWNDIPITLDHPVIAGSHVSGRDPKVLDQVKLGRIYNAHIKDGKLRAEGWFDLEAVKEVSPKVYKALLNGQQLELSTGLFVATEQALNGATDPLTGKPYDYIARNYVPDHLAILPDSIGACSIQDGCGVLVNSLLQGDNKKAEQALATYAQVSDFWGQLARTMVASSAMMNPINNTDSTPPPEPPVQEVKKTDNERSFMDRHQDLSQQVYERFGKKGGGPYADPGMMPYVVDVFDDYLVYSINGEYYRIGYSTNAEGNVSLSEDEPEQVRRVTGYEVTENSQALSEEDIRALFNANPAQPRKDNGRWEKNTEHTLRQAVRRGFIHTSEPDARGVGSGGSPWTDSPSSDDEEAAKAHSVETFTQGSETAPAQTSNSEGTMSVLNADQRKVMIDGLVSNCGCQGQQTPWSGKDRAALEKLSDNELVIFDECRKTIENTRKATKFVDAQGRAYQVNSLGLLEAVAQQTQPTPSTQTQTVNMNPALTIPQPKPQTAEEWLKNAPPEIQATLNFAKQIETQHKAGVIGEIVNNARLEGAARDAAINFLGQKSLEELNIMKMLSPPAPQPQNTQPPVVQNWAGIIGGPAPTAPTTNEEALESPNYQDLFVSNYNPRNATAKKVGAV